MMESDGIFYISNLNFDSSKGSSRSSVFLIPTDCKSDYPWRRCLENDHEMIVVVAEPIHSNFILIVSGVS
jgi:hypothetical protein